LENPTTIELAAMFSGGDGPWEDDGRPVRDYLPPPDGRCER